MRDVVDDRMRRDWTPSQIGHELTRLSLQDPPSIDPQDVPNLRTLQRYVREYRTADRSGDWSLGMTDPDDAPLVFDSLAAAISETDGDVRWITQAEAEWIVRIRRARPDFTPYRAYKLAASYAIRSAQGESTWGLDLTVALWHREGTPTGVWRLASRADQWVLDSEDDGA